MADTTRLEQMLDELILAITVLDTHVQSLTERLERVEVGR
jgi:hypothetical protein